MTDLEKQALRTAARQPACVESVTLPLPVDASKVHQVDCDPVPDNIPEVFEAPTAQPNVVSTPSAPIPVLSIGNTQQTATCAGAGGAPIGSDVVVAANTFLYEMLLQDIPNLTDSQGQFLATLTSDQLTSLISADAGAIEALCLLTPSQAAYLVGAIATAQTALNTQASTAATAQLNCVWHNTSQTANCAAGAVSTGVVAGAINPVTVAANTFSSTVSQDDANALALAAATAGLVCLWANTSVTRTCQDNGFSEAVPNDSSPVATGVPKRVGSVTIAAGTVISHVSQADANAQASAAADAALVCLYFNASITRHCSDSDGRNVTGTSSPGSGNAADGTTGDPVVVPAATVVSEVSTDDANASAKVLGDSVLDCYWVNASQTATCPDQTATANGTPGTVFHASSASPVLSATTSSGVTKSYVSQADADQQALLLAQAQLDCLYYNIAVPAVCPPSSHGGISAMQTTTGVASGTYCASQAADAQTIAESVASIPIAVQANPSAACSYGNDAVTQTCNDKLPGLSPDANSTVDAGATKTVSIAPDTFFATTIPGTPPAGVSTPKDYANYLARQAALSYLNCYFSNADQSIACSDTTGLAADARSPVAVAAGTFISYVSKPDANSMAVALGNSLRVCVYDNTAQTADACPDGEVATGVTTVAAHTMRSSVSQADANSLAKAMANATRACAAPTPDTTTNCRECSAASSSDGGKTATIVLDDDSRNWTIGEFAFVNNDDGSVWGGEVTGIDHPSSSVFTPVTLTLKALPKFFGNDTALNSGASTGCHGAPDGCVDCETSSIVSQHSDENGVATIRLQVLDIFCWNEDDDMHLKNVGSQDIICPGTVDYVDYDNKRIDFLSKPSSDPKNDTTQLNTSVRACHGAGPVSDSALKPWEFYQDTDGSIYCNPDSAVLDSEGNGIEQTVENLSDAVTPKVGDIAYLKIDTDNNGAVSLISLIVGDKWEGYPKQYKANTSVFVYIDTMYFAVTKFIDPSDAQSGKLIGSGSKKVKAVALCSENLMLVLRVFFGLVGWSVEHFTTV
jgi:hypothetical protein